MRRLACRRWLGAPALPRGGPHALPAGPHCPLLRRRPCRGTASTPTRPRCLRAAGQRDRRSSGSSWAAGSEAAATLRAALELVRADSTSGGASPLWGALVRGAVTALCTTYFIMGIGQHCSIDFPPYAKAVLATLCTREKLLGLLGVAAELLLAADEAAGGRSFPVAGQPVLDAAPPQHALPRLPVLPGLGTDKPRLCLAAPQAV